ncbi:hypothetical protein XELAEV_18028828mg [Xenopus laevis]|uniref:Uncharacterized protein n=1 Tax=Xenopus laevis TaxID=8355 RepID=A0A974HH78_XENLA|nr:hypothetical protein XELAEV_18028828mg [Xenopus laevis]
MWGTSCVLLWIMEACSDCVCLCVIVIVCKWLFYCLKRSPDTFILYISLLILRDIIKISDCQDKSVISYWAVQHNTHVYIPLIAVFYIAAVNIMRHYSGRVPGIRQRNHCTNQLLLMYCLYVTCSLCL